MKKNLITAFLVLGVVLAIFGGLNKAFGFIDFGYLSPTNHGDRNEWIKNHKVTYNRLTKSNLEYKNCLGCHEKKFKQTKDNFCNKCHRESGVKPVE